MKKRIVLCADDYGQAPAISQGIIALLKHERLSATSCMVNSACWLEHSQWLMPYATRIDIGLHFNLTEGKALAKQYIAKYGENFSGLGDLMQRSCLHKLDRKAIEAEFHAQLDQFIKALGRLPDFIDGHQHVHQFPVVRDALINVYEQRLRGHPIYIRWVNVKLNFRDMTTNIKKIIIKFLGTHQLKNLLDTHKIQYNQTFAGMYTFSQASQYATLFPRFLSEISDKGLIMCHPGLFSTDTADVIAKARYDEYQYFISNQFLLDCQQQGIILERFIMS